MCTLQSFAGLSDKPLMVDLTVEEGQRLKVIYGSSRGFHAIDLDTSSVFDIYIPAHVCLFFLAWIFKTSFCRDGILRQNKSTERAQTSLKADLVQIQSPDYGSDRSAILVRIIGMSKSSR